MSRDRGARRVGSGDQSVRTDALPHDDIGLPGPSDLIPTDRTANDEGWRLPCSSRTDRRRRGCSHRCTGSRRGRPQTRGPVDPLRSRHPDRHARRRLAPRPAHDRASQGPGARGTLGYAVIDNRAVVVAGCGRSAHWFRNLLSETRVEVELRGAVLAGTAEEITETVAFLALLRRRLHGRVHRAPLGAPVRCTRRPGGTRDRRAHRGTGIARLDLQEGTAHPTSGHTGWRRWSVRGPGPGVTEPPSRRRGRTRSASR